MNQKIILLSLGSLLLAGCAATQRALEPAEATDYMQAQEIPAAHINETPTRAQSYYPIPANDSNGRLLPSVVPPGSSIKPVGMPQRAVAVAPVRNTAVVAASNNTLVLNLGPQQAWSEVGKALRASGFQIAQQDQSVGTYYILDVGRSGRLQPNTPIYQVTVKTINNSARVTVYDEQNRPANPSASARILKGIKDHL